MAINNLQLYRGKKFDGLVDSNKLSNAFLTQPEIVNKTLSFVFGYHYNNPLALLTGGIGQTQYIDNAEFEWHLAGDLEQPTVITRLVEVGNLTPGIGGTPFKVALSMDGPQFVSGEVLIPNDRNFPVIVLGDGVQEGNEMVYTLQLLDGKLNPDKFMPPALLAPGKEFSKDFTAYEEGSSRSGITNYASPFALRNRLTIHRKHYEMTGGAATDVMVIALKDPKTGKESYLWETYAEWQFLQQWYRELDRAAVYNKFGVAPGENGRPVLTGAGLREQIAPANKRDYTVLTESVIREFLMDLSYNVIDQGKRKFVALCGEGFMDQFDRAMKDTVRGWQLVDTKFVTGSGQELTLGGQFTTYKGLNGTEVTLAHFPCYDDPVHNRLLHPETLRPLESYRATFIEYGNYDGKGNFVKMAKRGREQLMWSNSGSMDASGGKNSRVAFGSKFDGYEVEVLSEIGYKLHNPMSCGELVCNVEGV